jgi:hypothetical protein
VSDYRVRGLLGELLRGEQEGSGIGGMAQELVVTFQALGRGACLVETGQTLPDESAPRVI